MRKMVAMAAACLLSTSPAHAAYVINVAQSGSDVVATGSGSLNFTAYPDLLTGFLTGYVRPFGLFGTQQVTEIAVGATSMADFHYGLNIQSGTSDLMGTGSLTFASSSVGAIVGVQHGEGDGADVIYVPKGYVSGSDLGTSSSTFANQTIASLGLNPGTYIWTWGSGATADSFTVNILAPAAAVPEPRTWAMLTLGLGAIGGAMRASRRRLRFAV